MFETIIRNIKCTSQTFLKLSQPGANQHISKLVWKIIWVRFAILWSCGLWTEKNLNVSSEIVSWLTGQLTGVSQFAAHLGKYASPTLQYAHCTLYIRACCHETISSKTLAGMFFVAFLCTEMAQQIWKIPVNVFMTGNWFEVLASFTG